MPRWSRRRREDEGASSLSPLLPLRMRGSVAYDRVELSPLPSLDTSRLVGVVVETVRPKVMVSKDICYTDRNGWELNGYRLFEKKNLCECLSQ